jgi:hypothetical protein
MVQESLGLDHGGAPAKRESFADGMPRGEKTVRRVRIRQGARDQVGIRDRPELGE